MLKKNIQIKEKLNNKKNINMDRAALIMIFLKLYKKNPRTTQKFTPYKTSNL